MKIKKYILENREIHMVGDFVGICWNLEYKEKKLKGDDGNIYKTEMPERKGNPYIDFVAIRKYDNGEFIEDEDSSVAGGLRLDLAKTVSKELHRAIEYLEAIQNKGD